MVMKPYLKPRVGGVSKLDMYLEGMGTYLQKCRVSDLLMTPFPGSKPAEEARAKIIFQINHGFPIPCLMLRHTNPKMKDFTWHWFIINGYDYEEGNEARSFCIKTATYGEETWFRFEMFWDTGYAQKGGLILYDIA